VGAGGRVLLVAVPLEGMEQLEFDLDDESTPDATVLPDWSGEAVTCLSFSPDGQLLAAGGAAGTVRVWQLQEAVATAPSSSPVLVAAHNSTVPVATSGAAVGAVRWLPTPGGWVLLTGNRNNASLQLWHTAGDAGAAPLQWAPRQTLRFEGKDGQAEFYNQLDVVPAQQLVVLADTARKAVYTLHYSGMCLRKLEAQHCRCSLRRYALTALLAAVASNSHPCSKCA
jgi:WD40 repeat protein